MKRKRAGKLKPRKESKDKVSKTKVQKPKRGLEKPPVSPNRPRSSGSEVGSVWENDLHTLLHAAVQDQKPARMKVLGDVFRSVVKLAKESTGTLNLKITATALKELRFSFKLFYPHRLTPKITMFGSARVPPEAPLYDFAKKFAAEAVKRKYMIITGGGPGVMAAGNEGADLKGGFGLNIRLPVEQSANPFIDPKGMLIHYKYFFTRKLFLVKEASAFAFFPGGFGTFDEAFEVLTLLQTGKTSMIPIVMLEPDGYGFWTGVSEFLDKVVLGKHFISHSDKSLYRVYHSVTDALDHIDFFYSTYHSMRFVKQTLVIRLKRTPPAGLIRKLEREFGYVSMNGKYTVTGPLPEESNEPELQMFPRLCFPFDRKDFGNLRRLIDYINENTV